MVSRQKIPPPIPDDGASIASALKTLQYEIDGLAQMRDALDGDLRPSFEHATQTIGAISGRVVVSGMGKSGHVGRKIAATLASTGTPALYVHPGEASHGDLGMITGDDVVLALSWSGETPELANIISFAKRFAVPLIAVTSNGQSALGRAADIAMVLPQATEACPHGLAPTTSTAMQLALGDALAIALLETRGFTALQFKAFHPGGRLGAQLQYVSDIMHTGPAVPIAKSGAAMSEAIVLMSQKGFGSVGVTDAAGMLIGVITDGDLRRNLADNLITRSVDEVMTRAPKTIAPDAMVSVALETLQSGAITALYVVEDGRPIGIVHMHDLLRAGIA